jgi:hypothetical protein
MVTSRTITRSTEGIGVTDVDRDPADADDVVLVRKGPTTTKRAYHLIDADGLPACDTVDLEETRETARWKLPDRYSACAWCNPDVEVNDCRQELSFADRVYLKNEKPEDILADGGDSDGVELDEHGQLSSSEGYPGTSAAADGETCPRCGEPADGDALCGEGE